MAHTCPNCGMTCHCNGDIDDICLDDENDILHCICCIDRLFNDDYEDGYELDDFEDCDMVEGGCGCCPYDEPVCAKYFNEQGGSQCQG
jgi:hypothetical protein